MRALFVAFAAMVCWGQTPKFEGRVVSVTAAKAADEEGFFPQGPASVCIEGPPRKQCYTAPKDFGFAPQVELVQLDAGRTALLFYASSGGVSGSVIHYAILRPGAGDELEDMLFGGGEVSNQSQHAFWQVPEISEAPIFVTADYEWGPNESHYGPHRYEISAYVLLRSTLLDDRYYYLDDRYLTVRKYDQDEGRDVLIAEKDEIVARLKRVKQERDKSRDQ